MKKVFTSSVFALAAVAALSLSSCGEKAPETTTTTEVTTEEAPMDATTMPADTTKMMEGTAMPTDTVKVTTKVEEKM